MRMWDFVCIRSSMIGIINIFVSVPVLVIMAYANYISLIVPLNNCRIRDMMKRY